MNKISSDKYWPGYHINSVTGKPSLGSYDFSKFMELKKQEALADMRFTPSIGTADTARQGGRSITDAMNGCHDRVSDIREDAQARLNYMRVKLAEIRKNNGRIVEIERAK